MHPTYKHLEDRIRLVGLTLGQWAQLVCCALLAYLIAKTVPLDGSWPVSIGITIGGLPAAASIALMQQDFDVAVLARAAVVERRGPQRFRPGAGTGTERPARTRREDWAAGEWEALWD